MEPYLTALGLIRATGRVHNPSHSFPRNRINVNVFANMDSFAQDLMSSPSVFNFYLPDYTVPQSGMDLGGFAAPELQIHTTSTAFTVPNRFVSLIFNGSNVTYRNDVDAFANGDNDRRIDFMVDQWYHRPLSPEIRTIVRDMMDAIGSSRNSIHAAGRLLMSNPEFMVLR